LEISDWIARQDKILNSNLSRMAIADLMTKTNGVNHEVATKVRVWRNYAAEPMESALKLVGLYWGIEYDVQFTGYDDSYSFVELASNDFSTAVELLLIDRSHILLAVEEFDNWLRDRQLKLMSATGKPVVTAVLDDCIHIYVNESKVDELASQEVNGTFYDSRYERTTGSRLKPKTHVLLALELFTTWISSLLIAPRKLLAVDLDFTLHDGVLGELGEEVQVHDEFLDLQRELVVAKEKGYMLAILSKNNHSDVINLLKNHSKYVLKEADFVSIEASWDLKTTAMTRILQQTRINQDAVVFIDDNPVELMQMNAAFPGMALVSAANGPSNALTSLRYVPGYRRATFDNLGTTRIQDIQSNQEREALIVDGLASYYESAQPILGVAVNQEMHLDRLVDLGKRSNQFNLTLSRSDIEQFQGTDRVWVALSLRDKLSDSGIIGGILVQRDTDDVCVIRELFLSCRVLGRGLETSLLCSGISEAIKRLNTEMVEIPWSIGERNEPALKWLSEALIENQPQEPGSVTLSLPQLRELAMPPIGVQVEVTK
jgi:FkbH-like protein